MTNEELAFLSEVSRRSKDDYGMMFNIIAAAVNGVKEHAEDMRNYGVDMEIVANMAMNTRLFKGNEKFIAEKLEKWKPITSIKWDDQIKKLKEKND